jgi:2-oxoglutarate ferredoxin oxidoreductase subunit alpha
LKQLLKGNEALAEAAIKAGCRHYFNYPITPQSEVGAHMANRLPEEGGVYLQAESEIAAANMVLGAAAAGVRTMTSTSSPGMSLKTEAISYIAGSDLPCIIVNVQRAGPGLGGIQPAQADYFQAVKAPGHGDFKALVYAPNSVQEMVDITYLAFDATDHYRMPAIILVDGLLGQMMEPVTFPEDYKAPAVDKSWAVNGTKDKRPKNIVNSLALQAEKLEEIVNARYERYEIIKGKEVKYEAYLTDDADIVVMAYGATSRIVKSAIDLARAENIKVGMLRPITLWPYPEQAILDIIAKNDMKHVLVVEMNKGQMLEDVQRVVGSRACVHFYGRTGGVVPSPKEVKEAIEKSLKGGCK